MSRFHFGTVRDSSGKVYSREYMEELENFKSYIFKVDFCWQLVEAEELKDDNILYRICELYDTDIIKEDAEYEVDDKTVIIYNSVTNGKEAKKRFIEHMKKKIDFHKHQVEVCKSIIKDVRETQK